MKVMLDTNILISAFIFKSKLMNDLIYKLSAEYEIVICSYVIEELYELLESKFNVRKDELDIFLKSFPFTLVESSKNTKIKLFSIRDEDDYIILHTAIEKDIDLFITGDKDFFDVKVDKPKIISAREFFDEY